MFQRVFLSILVVSSQALAVVGGFDTSSPQMNDELRKMVSHTVALLDGQGSEYKRCTGTLIADNVILTAAHCLPAKLDSLWVVPSTVEYDALKRMPVVEVIKDRPANLPASTHFDLALAKFEGTLPTDYKPTTYARSFNPGTSSPFFLSIAGYGETFSGANDEGELRLGMALIFNYAPNIPEFRADQTNGMGICQGVSGGPAFVQIDGQYQVLGVVSATAAVNRQGMKVQDGCKGISFFQSTIFYQDWIATNLKKLLLKP